MTRRLLTALLALVALASCAAARPTPTPSRVPPPAPQVSTVPPTHLVTNGQAMPLGDSITAGFESTDGNGYRLALQTCLGNAGHPMMLVGSQQNGTMLDNYNEGHSGFTIAQLQAGVAGWLSAPPPTGRTPGWVLLDIGTNDARNGATSAQMLSSMSALLTTILAATTTTKVLVAQIAVTTSSGASVAQADADFDTQLPALAASMGWRVRVVDMRGVELSPDGIHPDDAGYQTMAARWCSAVTAWP